MPGHWRDDAVHALIEAAPDGVLLIDSEGVTRLANKATQRLLGYSNEELYGAKVELLIRERHHEAHLAHRAGYAAAPQPRLMGSGSNCQGCAATARSSRSRSAWRRCAGRSRTWS